MRYLATLTSQSGGQPNPASAAGRTPQVDTDWAVSVVSWDGQFSDSFTFTTTGSAYGSNRALANRAEREARRRIAALGYEPVQFRRALELS